MKPRIDPKELQGYLELALDYFDVRRKEHDKRYSNKEGIELREYYVLSALRFLDKVFTKLNKLKDQKNIDPKEQQQFQRIQTSAIALFLKVESYASANVANLFTKKSGEYLDRVGENSIEYEN